MDKLKQFESDLEAINNKYGIDINIPQYAMRFIEKNPGILEYTFLNQRFSLVQIILSTIQLYNFNLDDFFNEEASKQINLLKITLVDVISGYIKEKDNFIKMVGTIDIQRFIMMNHKDGYIYMVEHYESKGMIPEILNLFTKKINLILMNNSFDKAVNLINKIVYIDLFFNEKAKLYEVIYENDGQSTFLYIEHECFVKNDSYVEIKNKTVESTEKELNNVNIVMKKQINKVLDAQEIINDAGGNREWGTM